MMDNNNDNLQSRLDRFGQRWVLGANDWAHFRELAVLGLVDLCALSVGIDPKYAQLVRGMTTIDPDNIPKPEEIAELVAYRNDTITEWERRVCVAVNHVKAGTLPIVRNAAPLGGHDPYEALPADAENIVVKVVDFAPWAIGMGWKLPDEFPHPDAASYSVAPEGLQIGGAKWPWGNHETELLRKLAAAAAKFWANYDPGDNTTAPKSDEVAAWLKTQGVADRVAQIMAQILRPDGLPTGPRK